MANWIGRFLAAIAAHKSNASAHHTKTTAGELNLADMAEKAHGSLTGVSADQHHPQSHTLASHSTKAHGELTGVSADQHHPQSHTLASHSTKAHTELTGVTSDQHHAKVHGDAEHTKSYIEGSEVPTHETDPNVDATLKGVTKAEVQDHTPKAHTLASHSTKAHTELTGVTSDQHHPQSHNAASHSDIASSGANIDDAVAKKHAQAHTLASHSTKAHSELTGVNPNDHHTPYSHPGTPQCSGCPHPSGRYAHPGSPQCVGCPHASGRYTDTEAQATVKANVEVGDLKTPTKNLPMNSKKITGLGTPTATGDALRKGTRVTATELPALTDGKIWKGTGGNVEEVDIPISIANAAAGDVKEAYANTERNTNQSSYTKLKEIQIARGGDYRIKFALKSTDAGYSVAARVYKNGVAVGTEQTSSSTSYATKSEDISGWATGDLCQLYAKQVTATSCYVKNFQIYSERRMDFEVITN